MTHIIDCLEVLWASERVRLSTSLTEDDKAIILKELAHNLPPAMLCVGASGTHKIVREILEPSIIPDEDKVGLQEDFGQGDPLPSPGGATEVAGEEPVHSGEAPEQEAPEPKADAPTFVPKAQRPYKAKKPGARS